MESIMNLSVNELKTTPIIIDSSTPVSKAIGILKELNAYELFIKDSKKLGIVTIREILGIKNVLKTKVSSLMKIVPKLQPNTSINEAARIMMDYRIRALPIVEENRLIGQINILSILKAIKDKIPKAIRPSNIMTRNPITLKENDSIAKARRIMLDKKIDHLPINSFSNEVIGVLTSSDIVFKMINLGRIGKEVIVPEGKSILKFPVKEFIDVDPLISDPNECVSTILDRMIDRKKTYCLIKLWEELQGIITYRDYMKFFLKTNELNEVPIYIIGLPDDPFEAEMAKIKFTRIVKFFKKIFPNIIEARSNIKISSKVKNKNKQRYEVSVLIKTPKKMFTYSGFGWELSNIYDSILSKVKKVLSQKQSRRIVKSEKGF